MFGFFSIMANVFVFLFSNTNNLHLFNAMQQAYLALQGYMETSLYVLHAVLAKV